MDWLLWFIVAFIGVALGLIVWGTVMLITSDKPACDEGEKLQVISVISTGKVTTPIYGCR